MLTKPGSETMSSIPFEPAIRTSMDYLNSDPALMSVDVNPYWPKWDSPWWHMTALFEMGLAERIPKRIVERMLRAFREYYLPVFLAKELPVGRGAAETNCHCSLGTMVQIFSAYGVDVEHEIPWARPLLMRHVLADGGQNCDDSVYELPDPPSSMVGTIAPLEAILFFTKRAFTEEEKRFLDAGARFMIQRRLMKGSHDEERLDEEDWLKPCFPRFYLYDVLRGLRWLVGWAELRQQPLPAASVAEVLLVLKKNARDGVISPKRFSYEGITTRPRLPASRFELLEQVSALDRPSPFLTRQWRETLSCLDRLTEKKLLV